MVDALQSWKPEETSGGLWVKLKDGQAVKLRVLTLDPLVTRSKWGSLQYAFIVWNWNENKAQILQKPKSVLNALIEIHQDQDLPPLNKLDIKVTASGHEKDTRYSVLPLPTAGDMTAAMVEGCKQINLEKLVPNSIRLSKQLAGAEVPAQETESSGYDKAKQQAEKLKQKTLAIEDLGTIDLEDPFENINYEQN